MLKVWRQLADHENKPVWSVGFVKRQEWDFFLVFYFFKFTPQLREEVDTTTLQTFLG